MATTEEQKELALAFLKEQLTATLASVSSQGKPHAATIYYTVDDDFSLYFFTKAATSKYENIAANPQVALVITNASALQTVQVEGRAHEIADPNEAEEIHKRIELVAARHSPSLPPAQNLKDGAIKVIKIEPVWLRFGDFEQSDPRIKPPGFTQILP